MTRTPILALALAALAGCAPTLTPLPRPAAGYEAIRFVQPIELPSSPRFRIAAGTVYVQDRTREDGRRLWCRGGGDGFDCLELRDGGRVRIWAEVPAIGGEPVFELPQSAFERLRQ